MEHGQTSRETLPSRELSRKIVSFVLRITVAAALFAWLTSSQRLPLETFSVLEFDRRTLMLLSIGVIAIVVNVTLRALRLNVLLRANGLQLSKPLSLGVTFVGAFVGSILPGLIGGDAVRAMYLAGRVDEYRLNTVVVVMIDRAVGLWSLFLFGTLSSLAVVILAPGTVPSALLLICPAVVMISTIAALIFVSARIRKMTPVVWLFDRLPEQARRVVRAVRAYRDRRGAVIAAIILSLTGHATMITAYWIAGVVLRDPLAFPHHLVLDPLALSMNVVPITPAGIGITESAFSFLYDTAGSSNGAAVGLLGRFTAYVVYAFGGAVSLLALRLPSFRARDRGVAD